ncbi:hypothetical protein C5167_039639 [Papaver somniferum]|uniref:Uncharacterized protein n=1 Tax=Papaver somniferum TaxID=3469 RepID=A0A4Y7ICW4_PAPSO|nr:hypothetical protein C5167_039639 [Papaver somniferum]
MGNHNTSTASIALACAGKYKVALGKSSLVNGKIETQDSGSMGLPKVIESGISNFYKFQRWRKEHTDNVSAIPTDKKLSSDLLTDGSNGESDDGMKRFFNLPDRLFEFSLSSEYVECKRSLAPN